MADHAPTKKAAKPPRFHGWMAEFVDEDAMLVAARKVRDGGYTKTDAFTPFPVHGIDEALGIKPTILPFIVLCCGLTGTATAFIMQIWMNAIDYPYIISGKPMLSIPAFIPVGFELTILFSAFSTFFGMLALNGLFRFSNPVFSNPSFDRATSDRFFLFVDARDKYFNRESVRELLASTSPDGMEEVIEDSTPTEIPRVIWLGLVVLLAAAMIPAAIVLNIRSGRSPQPRFHVFFDMDFQPKKKPQSSTTIFADGRSERPQVLGTFARGQLPTIDPYILGYDPTKIAVNGVGNQRFVALQEEVGETETEPAEIEPAETPAAETPAVEEKPTAESKPASESEEAKPAAEETEAEPEAEEAKPSDAEKPAEMASEKPTETSTEAEPEKPVDTTPPASAAAPDSASMAPAALPPELPFLTNLPIEPTAKAMALGKLKFETYCTACHGYAGDGDGLAARRAAALNQGYWLQPTSLHDAKVQTQPVGQIYYTISNGKGKMGSYGAVLTPEERWAVVMYVRALQRAKNAKIEDVPKEQRGSIQTTTATPTN